MQDLDPCGELPVVLVDPEPRVPLGKARTEQRRVNPHALSDTDNRVPEPEPLRGGGAAYPLLGDLDGGSHSKYYSAFNATALQRVRQPCHVNLDKSDWRHLDRGPMTHLNAECSLSRLLRASKAIKASAPLCLNAWIVLVHCSHMPKYSYSGKDIEHMVSAVEKAFKRHQYKIKIKEFIRHH